MKIVLLNASDIKWENKFYVPGKELLFYIVLINLLYYIQSNNDENEKSFILRSQLLSNSLEIISDTFLPFIFK